jgi:protein-S-isoprenylcysteine O-methyltransferase Ste14
MHDQAMVRPSPWWYRQRGAVIGAIYFVGFALGYWVPAETSPVPVAVTWGEALAGGPGVELLLWAAVASALIAWFWRASGTAYLRRDVVFAADVQRDRLIVAGVFRYVRNPLYVGNVFLALAVALLAPPVGFAVIVAGNALFVVLLAREEALGLEARYGEAYAAYRRAVPAFFPRLTPADVPGSVTVAPSVAAGLMGEGFCLGLALAIVPLAVFGQAGLPAFYAIWIASFGAWAMAGWLAGRRRNSGTAR